MAVLQALEPCASSHQPQKDKGQKAHGQKRFRPVSDVLQAGNIGRATPGAACGRTPGAACRRRPCGGRER